MADIAGELVIAMAGLRSAIGFLPKSVDNLSQGTTKLVPMLDRANLALLTIGTTLERELSTLRTVVKDLPGNIGQNILVNTLQLTAGFNKVDKDIAKLMVWERLTGQNFQQHIIALRSLQLVTALETTEIGTLVVELDKTSQVYGVQTGLLIDALGALLPEFQSISLLGGNIPGLSKSINKAIGEFGPGSEKMVTAFVREALKPSNIVQTSLLNILGKREELLSDDTGQVIIEMIRSAGRVGKDQLKGIKGMGDSLFSLGVLDDIFGPMLRLGVSLDKQADRDKQTEKILSLNEKLILVGQNMGVIFEEVMNPIFDIMAGIRNVIVKVGPFGRSILSSLVIGFGISTSILGILVSYKSLQLLQLGIDKANLAVNLGVTTSLLGIFGWVALIGAGIAAILVYTRRNSDNTKKTADALARSADINKATADRTGRDSADSSFTDSVRKVLSANLARLVQGTTGVKNPNNELEIILRDILVAIKLADREPAFDTPGGKTGK